MGSPPARSRVRIIAWCLLVPLGVVVGYLGLGFAVVSAVGEPILGTAVLGAVVALFVGAARLLRPRWLAHAPARKPPAETPHLARMVLGCLVLAFLAGQSLALWLYALGGSAGFDQSVQARQDAGVITALALVLVAAPLAEEMLFRGLLYPLLRRRAGILASVLITAAVFALMHGNLVQFASVLPLAVLLALVYERTRTVWPCVLMHLAFNLVAMVLPAPALSGLANPVSALLLTIAFLGCALAFYKFVIAPAGPVAAVSGTGGGGGEEGEPRAA